CGIANTFTGKLRKGRLIGIYFYQPSVLAGSSKRPIDDVTEGRGRADDEHEIARSSSEKIFYSLNLASIQLLAEPDNAGAHEPTTVRAIRKIDIFSFLLLLSAAEIATRTARNENVAVNLHDLIWTHPFAFP